MTTTPRLANLTMYERVGLNRQFNLADGHTHQLQEPAQREIIRGLPAVFADGERTPQADLETAFQRTFYRLARQDHAVRHPRTLLCSSASQSIDSASQSIDLVAAFLSARGMSVGLLQPCFDNLAASSADVYRGLMAPHNDLLLNVSPFVLRLLVEYLADAETDAR